MQIKDKLSYHKYPLLIFLMFSFIPFYWLHGHPVGWGDTGLYAFFYNSNFIFEISRYTWNHLYLTGHISGQSITLIPLSGIFMLLSSLGFNNYIQQGSVYSLVLFLSMSFTYLFTYEIFNYRIDKKLIATISAIFYTFNPLTMITYWQPGMLSLYLIPFIPLVLFLSLLVIKRQKFIYVLLIALAFSLFSITFLNPAFVIPILMILASFFLYQIALSWKNRKKVKNMFIYTVLSTIFIFLINMWFILPFIPSISAYYTAAITAMNPLQTLIGVSHGVGLDMFFRSIPMKLDLPVWMYKNPGWRYYYNNPLFIIIGFLIFFLILTPLLSRKKDKNVLFFAILLIMGLFLSNGLNPPFGHIFGYLFKNVTYFDIFRSPRTKFMPFLLVSYAVLFGMGITILYNQIKYKIGVKYSKLITIILLFLVLGVYVFPMWSGSVINTPITIRGNEISRSEERRVGKECRSRWSPYH